MNPRYLIIRSRQIPATEHRYAVAAEFSDAIKKFILLNKQIQNYYTEETSTSRTFFVEFATDAEAASGARHFESVFNSLYASPAPYPTVTQDLLYVHNTSDIVDASEIKEQRPTLADRFVRASHALVYGGTAWLERQRLRLYGTTKALSDINTTTILLAFTASLASLVDAQFTDLSIAHFDAFEANALTAWFQERTGDVLLGSMIWKAIGFTALVSAGVYTGRENVLQRWLCYYVILHLAVTIFHFAQLA